MQFGLATMFGNTPRRDFGFVREVSVAVEELGFTTLYLPEHVVFFAEYNSKYPYSVDGTPNWGPDTGIYDPLFVAAAGALATTRLRFASSVMILPQRPALLVAKEVMTLDHLSGSRFDLGIGIGWSDEEFAALGVPFARRGKRADEYLEAMRVAWTEPRATYHGEFVSFDGVVLNPKPLNGTVPIVVGGDSTAAMRRAARLGEAWYGWWAKVELEPHLATLAEVAAAENRALGLAAGTGALEVRVGLPIATETPDQVAAKVAEASRLGVDQFVLAPPVPAKNLEATLRMWAEVAGLV